MENRNEEEEEKMIPVLTVRKNNAILKNIFFVLTQNAEEAEAEAEAEQTIVVGRSPDCNITLSHPSISRFHLHILFRPSSSSLSLLDLSSVHGTWVMGKKIEPNVQVELKEGDTLQLGGSSRVYRLHWVPLSQAYDMENPFVSPSDGCLHAEDNGQTEKLQSDNGLHESDQIQSLDDNSEVSDHEVSDEKSSYFLNDEISVLPFSEKEDAEHKGIADREPKWGIISDDFSEQLATESETETETSSWYGEIFSVSKIKQFAKDQNSSQKLVDRESEQNPDFLASSASLYPKEYIENPFSANFSLFSESEIQQLDKESESQQYQKSSQKLMDRGSDQNLVFLERRSASPYLKEYSENPVSTNFNLFSKVEIQQLDKKSESQKENICTSSENNTTSKTDQQKKLDPSTFSVMLATEYESSYLSDEIFLETENKQFDDDRANTKVVPHKELEQNVDVLESLVALFSHEVSEHSCSPDVKLLREVENQEMNKENENQVENSGTSLVKVDKQCNTKNWETSKRVDLKFETDLSDPGSIEDNEATKSSFDSLDAAEESFPDKENCTSNILTDSSSVEETSKRVDLKFETSLSDPGSIENNEATKSSFDSLDAAEEAFTPDKENCTSNILADSSSVEETSKRVDLKLETYLSDPGSIENNEATKSSFDSLDAAEEAFTPDKENCTSNILADSSSVKETSKRVDLKIETDLSDPGSIENNEAIKSSFDSLNAAEAFTPDQENCTSNILADSSSVERKEEIPKNLFTDLNETNEQFTPDKENFTPNTLLRRSIVKMSMMKDTENSNLYISSALEHIVSGSIKVIPSPKLLQEWELTRSSSRTKKDRKLKSGMEKSSAKGGPLQPLFEYSSGISKLEASPLHSTNKSCKTMKHANAIEEKEKAREDKRKWCMVVDTSCLLDSGSRKALQLLQGIKGTQVIIPRTVIRELDSMNRQGSIFVRRTEAFCALQWIEECLVNTDWWIHIESSDEESMPIEPTPSSIPESRFSEMYRRFCGETAGSVFTALGSWFEIVSPTADDHALEYALQLRGNGNDRKFVLLSNDHTVKIKAMAEGLMCETAQDFRRSLVNPFSERFLWSGSSPRGLTWSCMDDIILKEKFYGYHNKLGAGEGAKGLNLIVLHNTRYARSLSVTS